MTISTNCPYLHVSPTNTDKLSILNPCDPLASLEVSVFKSSSSLSPRISPCYGSQMDSSISNSTSLSFPINHFTCFCCSRLCISCHSTGFFLNTQLTLWLSSSILLNASSCYFNSTISLSISS